MKIELRGRYLIEALDATTGELLKAWRLENLLTTANQTVRDTMLAGTYTGGNDSLQIAYFAFGTGTTAPAVTDTALETEVYRKQVTQVTVQSTGSVKSLVSLGSNECNTTITEIGIFCGPSATSTANTGTLISRIAVNIVKNSNIVLNITRTDTCSLGA